jgi:Amt family ammonium transporter
MARNPRMVLLALPFLLILLIPFAYSNPTGTDDFYYSPSSKPINGKTELAQITKDDLAKQMSHNMFSLDFTWVLLAGFLVMFMQTGFSLVEAGFCRRKNAHHVFLMNFLVYPVAGFAFFLIGFAIMMGGSNLFPSLNQSLGIGGWNLFGMKGALLAGASYDVGVFMLFLFQLVFMDTAATIVTGAMAERWKFSAFIIFSLFMGGIIYPVIGAWAWGNGWLSQLSTVGLGTGYKDFAGSGVVHMVGGFAGLVGAWYLGPRIGKYGKDNKPKMFRAHNLGFVIVGTFILAFGWFGFNAGSTLASTDLRISIVAVNTMLASFTGAISAILISKFYTKAWWDGGMAANGMLAGLVAITAPSAFVNPLSASIIGLVAGILVFYSVWFFDWIAKIDDPVGAISVHGICGIWGVLSVGIFSDGTYLGVKGLLYDTTLAGGLGQLLSQVIGIFSIIIWVSIASFACHWLSHKLAGIRVTKEEELTGLDVTVHGAPAYSDDD